jgi:hypothetical protein
MNGNRMLAPGTLIPGSLGPRHSLPPRSAGDSG